jgi:Tol biopolymer transport system component
MQSTRERFHSGSPGLLRGFCRLLQRCQTGFDIFQLDGFGQVTVYDRQGKVTATAGTPSAIISAKLSPDEHRMLVSTFTGQWLVEPNGSGNLRVRRGPSGMTMLWSTDGSHFLIPDAGRILERPVNEAEGSKEHEREVARVPGLDRLEDVSPDGKTILFTSGALSAAVYSVRLEGPAAERAPRPAVQTGERAFHTRFSPDGRWILYELDPEQANSGGIYVQPFPGPGLRKQIAHGGLYPVWRKDGKEILYLDSEGAQDRLWSIRVEAAGTDLRFGPPEKLFPVGQLEGGLSDINQLAVSRDGSRIFYPRAAEQPDSNVIHVRIGWSQP